MAFVPDEIDKLTFTPNVVVYFKTRAKYFAIDQPDSGLTVPANQRGLIDPKVNASTLSLEDARTSFQTFNFGVVDKSLVMTAEMSGNENLFMNEEIEIYLGRMTGSFAFADYFQLPTMRIRSFEYTDNVYKFVAESLDATFKRPSFNAGGVLNADTSSGAGSLVLSANVTDFPAAGKVFIKDGENSEVLAYTSISTDTITLTGTTAHDHNKGVEVWNNDTVSGNPLDIAMQLLSGGTDALSDTLSGSHGAGSTTLTATTSLSGWAATGQVYISDGASSEFVEYTSISGLTITLAGQTANAHGGGETIFFVLRDGLLFDPTLFDTTEIEGIRDEFFSGDTFNFELHNITDTLEWVEREIFLPNNLRFVTGNANGLYTFALLDQLDFAGTTITFDETNVIGRPKYKTSNRAVRTTVRLNYGYNYETDTYSTFLESTDASALANYGAQEPFVVDSQGIPDSVAGDLIATDRVTRWLERLSTTRPTLTIKTMFSEFDANIGTGVLVDLALPDETGTLNFAKDLEVIKKTIDLKNNVITWELSATAETGLRRAFISPSDLVVTVPTTSSITVASGRGAQYKAGWVMNFFVDGTDTAAGNTTGTISTVVSDTITFTAAHGLSIGERIKFANYDQVSQDQKRYSFIIDDALSVFASDSTPPYQITF